MRRATRALGGVLVGVCFTGLAGGAHAADATATAPPAEPPPLGYAAPPGYGPPPNYGPPPGYAPGFAPYPPPGPYYGNGQSPVLLYEALKKSEWLAAAIELFIPGVGSIYADHVAGAIVTWATILTGTVLIFWWIRDLQTDQDGWTVGSGDPALLYLGLGLFLGGHIYGLVDAYTSARAFNRDLRARLGLPDWASLGVVPIHTDRALAWGPSLTFRF